MTWASHVFQGGKNIMNKKMFPNISSEVKELGMPFE
jgi:hypothetical protein